jgi:hypothetical protein
MFARVVLAFLVLPGVVAFLVPALLAYAFSAKASGSPLAWFALGVGFSGSLQLLLNFAALWFYVAFVAVGFQIRVVVAEEPWLTRTFGEEWAAYKSRSVVSSMHSRLRKIICLAT